VTAQDSTTPLHPSDAAPQPGGEVPFRYTSAFAGELEQRWQDTWDERGTYFAANPSGPLTDGSGAHATTQGRSFFVMDMFPYPSGAGLHVGHPLGYIATDVVGRFRRMQGDNVLHALGYDAFGLPAEQYAVQTGQHPRITTEANIVTMRRQLRRLGLGHDPRRTFATTDSGYVRWTQWIFLQIFNSWYDPDATRPDGGVGRARPIDELVAAYASGRKDLPEDAPARTWDALDEVARRRVSMRSGSPTSRTRRSTGARVWGPCWPTRRSPPTDGASAGTIPSTSARCGSGRCASPRTRTASPPTST
jgi:leucyl-tRNA synthetase